MTLHVLHEASSPPEATVWTMWCGAQCIALDSGELIPEDMDFYLEFEAARADCIECLKAKLSGIAPAIPSEVRVPGTIGEMVLAAGRVRA